MKQIALTDQEITKIIQSCISYREWLRGYIPSVPENLKRIPIEEHEQVQSIINRMVALEETE